MFSDEKTSEQLAYLNKHPLFDASRGLSPMKLLSWLLTFCTNLIKLEPTDIFKIHPYTEGFHCANPMLFSMEILSTNSQLFINYGIIWTNSVLTLYVHLGTKSN